MLYTTTIYYTIIYYDIYFLGCVGGCATHPNEHVPPSENDKNGGESS